MYFWVNVSGAVSRWESVRCLNPLLTTMINVRYTREFNPTICFQHVCNFVFSFPFCRFRPNAAIGGRQTFDLDVDVSVTPSPRGGRTTVAVRSLPS